MKNFRIWVFYQTETGFNMKVAIRGHSSEKKWLIQCKRQHAWFQWLKLTFIKYSLLYIFTLNSLWLHSSYITRGMCYIFAYCFLISYFWLQSLILIHSTELSSPNKDIDSITAFAIKQASLLDTAIDKWQLNRVQLSECMKYSDKCITLEISQHTGLKSISGCLSQFTLKDKMHGLLCHFLFLCVGGHK